MIVQRYWPTDRQNEMPTTRVCLASWSGSDLRARSMCILVLATWPQDLTSLSIVSVVNCFIHRPRLRLLCGLSRPLVCVDVFVAVGFTVVVFATVVVDVVRAASHRHDSPLFGHRRRTNARSRAHVVAYYGVKRWWEQRHVQRWWPRRVQHCGWRRGS